VLGLKPAVPSSASPAWISLKNAEAVGVLIEVQNATTVTGSAITLNQATDVSGTNSKALAFTDYYKINDLAAADAPWTRAVAASNTFTTDATNSKNSYYFIPVDPASLDVANKFNCLQVGVGNATASTVGAHYLLRPKNAGNPTLTPKFTAN